MEHIWNKSFLLNRWKLENLSIHKVANNNYHLLHRGYKGYLFYNSYETLERAQNAGEKLIYLENYSSS